MSTNATASIKDTVHFGLHRPPSHSQKTKQNIRPTFHIFHEVDGLITLFVHIRGAATAHSHKLYRETTDIPNSEWTHGKFMGHDVPRLVRWHNLVRDGTYKFGGRKHKPRPYLPELLKFQHILPDLLRQYLGDSVGGVPLKLNSIRCCNLIQYRTKDDSISFHADDEVELGDEPLIVSVTLGHTRTFIVKRMTERNRKKHWQKRDKTWVENPDFKREKLVFELAHGDIFVMAGAAQDFWLHGINKESKKKTSEVVQLIPGRDRFTQIRTHKRFCFTFRTYNPPPADT